MVGHHDTTAAAHAVTAAEAPVVAEAEGNGSQRISIGSSCSGDERSPRTCGHNCSARAILPQVRYC